jgi:hypothetical protein
VSGSEPAGGDPQKYSPVLRLYFLRGRRTGIDGKDAANGSDLLLLSIVNRTPIPRSRTSLQPVSCLKIHLPPLYEVRAVPGLAGELPGPGQQPRELSRVHLC